MPVRNITLTRLDLVMDGDGQLRVLHRLPVQDIPDPPAKLLYLPAATEQGHGAAVLHVQLADDDHLVIQITWRLLAASVRAFAARYGWGR